MANRKKPDFPNNWKWFKEAPDEAFPTPSFEEVQQRTLLWDLPESVCCVIRATDPDTKRITEHVYLKASAAESRIQKLLDKEGAEVLVMEHEDIYRFRNQPVIEPMWFDDMDHELDGEDVG